MAMEANKQKLDLISNLLTSEYKKNYFNPTRGKKTLIYRLVFTFL